MYVHTLKIHIYNTFNRWLRGVVASLLQDGDPEFESRLGSRCAANPVLHITFGLPISGYLREHEEATVVTQMPLLPRVLE